MVRTRCCCCCCCCCSELCWGSPRLKPVRGPTCLRAPRLLSAAPHTGCQDADLSLQVTSSTRRCRGGLPSAIARRRWKTGSGAKTSAARRHRSVAARSTISWKSTRRCVRVAMCSCASSRLRRERSTSGCRSTAMSRRTVKARGRAFSSHVLGAADVYGFGQRGFGFAAVNVG